MSQSISSVKTVCFSINKSNPPQLSVSASGSVSSSGWKGGALIPRIYVVQPQDGIQDFDFVAESPSGTVLWVISPISGDGTIELEKWIKGVRVHAATNSITALLSEAACAVGQGSLSDHYLHATSVKQPDAVCGPKETKLPGGNGGPTGRPN